MRNALVVFAVLLVASCGDSRPPSRRASAPAPRATPATPERRAATPRRAPSLDRDAAVALVGRWLDAQNRGDFEAYQALYAPGFAGVKRTTRRTQRFERAGWLEDRRRMFRRPMQVTATGIVVLAQGDSAAVTFVQRWASGSYADEGTKRMQLVLVDGKPAIRFEELLPPSRMADSEVALDAGVMLVTTLSDHHAYVVLGRAPADMHGGPIHLLGSGRTQPYFAAREVAREDEGHAAALFDEPLAILGSGSECTTHVKALRLVRGAEVMDESMVADELESDDDEPTYGPIQAERVWETSAFGGAYGEGDGGRPWLVGELDGPCALAGQLALRSVVAQPERLAVETLSTEDATKYAEAFGRTPGGRAYEEDTEHPRGFLASLVAHPMTDHEDGDPRFLEVRTARFGTGDGASTLLDVFADGECGGSHSTVLLVGPPDAPTLVTDGYPSSFRLLGAYDLERDGVPEVVAEANGGGELFLLRLGARPGVLRRFSFTIQVCDC